jgi:hypothetical protein
MKCARCRNKAIIADTEAWDNPLCVECYIQHSPDGMFRDAMSEINNVIIEGEKTHSKDEWRKKNDLLDHLMHAKAHIQGAYKVFPHLSDGKEEDHKNLLEDISHAATRCLMALQLFKEHKK